jgi:hypothetical protein
MLGGGEDAGGAFSSSQFPFFEVSRRSAQKARNWGAGNSVERARRPNFGVPRARGTLPESAIQAHYSKQFDISYGNIKYLV